MTPSQSACVSMPCRSNKLAIPNIRSAFAKLWARTSSNSSLDTSISIPSLAVGHTSTVRDSTAGVSPHTRGFGGFAICEWDKNPMPLRPDFHQEPINKRGEAP